MMNVMTVDVEDYYMVSALSDIVRFEDWPGYESRVVGSTRKILGLFSEGGIKGTFFVLGWVAERFPELLREIDACGHEIACHSYRHRLIYEMTPEEFREDTRRAKSIIEESIGKPISGYRAPSYSITGNCLWALDILIEEGFSYDSSIFPIYHDRYGMPGAQRFAHVLERPAGRLQEVPPSTIRLMNYNFPVAGGGYLRLAPSRLTSMAISHLNSRESRPAIVYIHPWEIDDGQPVIARDFFTRLRHHVNIGKTFEKLKRLMGEFSFQPMSSLIQTGSASLTVQP